MTKIPVTFELNSKEYHGTLDEVAGAGAQVWHLMVDRHYWGALQRNGMGWVFNEQYPRLAHLAKYFGEVVAAWYG